MTSRFKNYMKLGIIFWLEKLKGREDNIIVWAQDKDQ
jgi:hypothetical protein